MATIYPPHTAAKLEDGVEIVWRFPGVFIEER
jgi:hypothetical protein